MTRTKTANPQRKRFMSKVGTPTETGCWPWLGSIQQGYAIYSDKTAARVAVELFTDRRLTRDDYVKRSCGNNWCVYPEHLTVVTISEHFQQLRGSTSESCGKGHQRTVQNTYIRLRKRNGKIYVVRECRVCAGTTTKPPRKWTREAVIEAIQKWAAEHDGKPPSARQWLDSKQRGEGYPPATCVYARKPQRERNWRPPFITWASAIEAAGFPRPEIGKYERKNRGSTGDPVQGSGRVTSLHQLWADLQSGEENGEHERPAG